jgi:hypothetical protein
VGQQIKVSSTTLCSLHIARRKRTLLPCMHKPSPQVCRKRSALDYNIAVNQQGTVRLRPTGRESDPWGQFQADRWGKIPTKYSGPSAGARDPTVVYPIRPLDRRLQQLFTAASPTCTFFPHSLRRPTPIATSPGVAAAGSRAPHRNSSTSAIPPEVSRVSFRFVC